MKPITSVHLNFKCPKAFNELQPCNGGWYCDGCHKIVHDFRGMEEQSIKVFITNSPGKVCGMFEADRVSVAAPVHKWRKLLSAAVMAMGFTGLYQRVQAQVHDSIIIPEPKITVTDNPNVIFGGTENSAEFPGGIEMFYKFIATHVVPDSTCKPGEKAFFTFVVETDGRLTDIKIMRSPYGKAMNERLIKMFENSPRWKPGSQNGRLVRQQYTVPVMAIPIH